VNDLLPPLALIRDHTLHVQGDAIVDEYAWLEDKTSPEVIAYLEAENRYTQELLAPVRPLIDQLYREMRGRIKEADVSAPVRHGPYLYYTRTETGREHPIYCRRRAPDGPEELLLDANVIADELPFCNVALFRPSPDHTKIAYGVDTTGSWVYTLRVIDAATGEHLPDCIPNVGYNADWANDGRTLLYTVFDQAHRPFKLFRHTLGADPADATLIYHEPDERFDLDLHKSRSNAFFFLTATSWYGTKVSYLPADNPTAELRTLAAHRPKIDTFADHQGDRFLIRTNDGAENFRLLTTPVATPEPQHWTEVIPHRPEIYLGDVEPFAEHLVLYERRAGLERIRITDPNGINAREVTFPEPVYSFTLGPNPEYHSPTLRFTYSSPVTPPTDVDYDLAGGAWRQLKQQEIVGYTPTQYVCERLHASAPDGAQVPISLVRRRDRAPDTGGPALLIGYGAYGSSFDPEFDARWISLLDRGFVVAIGHIRGGQELGRAWYEQGRLLHKKNSFTDFIACAEHLVAQGYTRPDQLAITGTSAGGLLVSAVTNMRPDLFRAVIARVPWTNVIASMIKPELPLTVPEWDQWGNPADPEQYRYMRSYDPYEHIAVGPYPHIMATAGLTDLQVPYWDPAKWVARLRARKTDANILILRTNMAAGHGGASGRFKALEERAEEYGFLICALELASE
jgi:oligopeptidase B